MTNITYTFILGLNHTLTTVEILNVLTNMGIGTEVVESSMETLIVSLDKEIDATILINKLGSTVKIGQVFATLDKENFAEKFLTAMENQNFGNNFRFGLSVYHSGGKLADVDKLLKDIPDFCRQIKTSFENKGIKTDYLLTNERKFSSVSVDKNDLLKNGFEFCLCASEEKIYLAKTLAIQDYENYSFRDYGRPERNPKSGMIPPKLAKMMINLAGKNANDTLLDPFCGSGTILQEMILLGYKNIIGTDINPEAFNQSQKNTQWLFENYPIERADINLKLFITDATKIASAIDNSSVDAIITEPYLGPSHLKFFWPNQIKKEIAKLETLYLNAFVQFQKILKPDGKIVIIFPAFFIQGKLSHLEIIEKIFSLGFHREGFLPPTVSLPKEKLEITPRNSIIYFRPGQKVCREIFIFKKA